MDQFANLAKQDFAMNIKHFQETNTLTMEHAWQRADTPQFSFVQVAA